MIFHLHFFFLYILVSKWRQSQTTPINSELFGILGAPCWEETQIWAKQKIWIGSSLLERYASPGGFDGHYPHCILGAANFASCWYRLSMTVRKDQTATFPLNFGRIWPSQIWDWCACLRVHVCVFMYGFYLLSRRVGTGSPWLFCFGVV